VFNSALCSRHTFPYPWRDITQYWVGALKKKKKKQQQKKKQQIWCGRAYLHCLPNLLTNQLALTVSKVADWSTRRNFLEQINTKNTTQTLHSIIMSVITFSVNYRFTGHSGRCSRTVISKSNNDLTLTLLLNRPPVPHSPEMRLLTMSTAWVPGRLIPPADRLNIRRTGSQILEKVRSHLWIFVCSWRGHKCGAIKIFSIYNDNSKTSKIINTLCETEEAVVYKQT